LTKKHKCDILSAGNKNKKLMKNNETNHYRPATLDDIDAAATRHYHQHLDGIFKAKLYGHAMDAAAHEAKQAREAGVDHTSARNDAIHYAAALALQGRENDIHMAQSRVFNATNDGMLYEAAEREDTARTRATVEHITVTAAAEHAQHIPVQVGPQNTHA
jgi:hypothetical protein